MKNKLPKIFLITAIATLLTGIAVIIGWISENTFLKTWGNSNVTMKFNTALCFILSSIVLLINYYSAKKEKQPIVSIALSCIITSTGLLTLLQFILGFNLGIDEFFVKDEFNTTATYFAGRMSPLTAINFVLIGTGLLLLNKESTAGYQFFYLSIVAFIALLVFIGFNFSSTIPSYIYFSVHSAAGFLLLAVAIWFSQPQLHKKIRFDRRLLTGFGAVILLIVILGIFSYHYSNRRIITSGWIRHTNMVLSETGQTLSLIKDIESGGRGYLISQDSAYLTYFFCLQKKVLSPI
ncbi:MAG: CHASE3 domain-containing protein [Ferruginibacter sp.]|nr:CHASE3 domain-containing protein [Ferruginibacter sp.]